MVQRPFSDNLGLFHKNISQHTYSNGIGAQYMISPPIETKTELNDLVRPKMSTMASSPPVRQLPLSGNSTDIRTPRNTNRNQRTYYPSTRSFFPDHTEVSKDNSTYDVVTQEVFYQLSEANTFADNAHHTPNMKSDITIPENPAPKDGNKMANNMYMSYPDTSEPIKPPAAVSQNIIDMQDVEENRDKNDFFIQEVPSGPSFYSYNDALNPNTCTVLQENIVDIDAQKKFLDFDLEPSWIKKKHYWNNMFESRYEFLMTNPKWPPLKVILIPRTHISPSWTRSYNSYQNDTVNIVLLNVIKKMRFYTNLTFTWNEISQLSEWWKTSSQKTRSIFRRLVKTGRLEITTGIWLDTDESTTHLFGLVHLLIEGHQWLKRRLNYSPKVAWLTNSVTHSPTMSYLISACGISNLIMTNLHFAWEHFLAEYQHSDFVWVQNWDNDRTKSSKLDELLKKIGNDRFPKHSVLTHYLQFNSAEFSACGPNKDVCVNRYDFANTVFNNLDINTANLKERSEVLLEQYSKTGTLTPHNVIIAPIGGTRRYRIQTEFDYQFNNYKKIADFVNLNSDIYKATMNFGTPSNYFEEIVKDHQNYASLKGDFLNYADIDSGSPAYWAGFFTTRPMLKILLRRLQSTLRTTEILFTFAVSTNAFGDYNSTGLTQLLIRARQNFARLLDRNVVGGTLSSHALKYVHNLILSTAKDFWYIQEVTVSHLSSKPGEAKPYLQKYVYRDGEFVSIFKTVSPGDQIYVFNSMGNERTEVVELVTRHPHIRITDHNNVDVTIQINPVWKYSSDNTIRISRSFFKIIFVIEVPPLALELLKIKEIYDGTNNAATIYCMFCRVDLSQQNPVLSFAIHPVEEGDIVLESYKLRLTFDEVTGFLKKIAEKETSHEKNIVLDYGAFVSSDKNAGIYLFNTNISKPIQDILMPYRTGVKTKVLIISAGQITTELTSVFGSLLQHTVRIYNLIYSPLARAIYVESKVDFEMSPKHRELELFLSIKTDITNGYNPEIFIDNNGFQHTNHILNISRRVESNMYPITTMAFIQDTRSRLTFITDHAQGITALQEGQLVVMLDRRILFDDGRGVNEGLADSSATCHRHFLLLENLLESTSHHSSIPMEDDLILPSPNALYLVNSLNYFLDIFTIDKEHNNLMYYAFLPMVKAAFPCDVALLNYRVLINENSLKNESPNSALMILHRQAASCQLPNSVANCNSDTSFSLNKILRNLRAVYKTNLVGTSSGIPMPTCDRANFPPMELLTLRVHF